MNAPAQVSLPQDHLTEQAVLGACFRNPDLIDLVAAACGAGDFFHHPHGDIAHEIFAMKADGGTVTPLTIGLRLASNVALRELGGKDYLGGLLHAAPSGGVVALARSLADLRLRREGIEAAQHSQEMLAEPSISILEAMRPMLEASDHAASTLGKRQHMPVREAADLMLKHCEERASGKGSIAATTGLNLLDETIGGLQGGDLVVYAGRPGMGKSALLMTTALRVAMEGRPSIVFSLEMTQERLLQRLACDLDYDANPQTPLSYSWFHNGSAKHDSIARLAEAVRRIPDNLTIFDSGAMTIHEIAAHARAHAARSQQMGVVIIDYLQKVDASDRYKGNRVQEVTEISGAAKALAMRLKWPVVVGAQLNRGVESREEKRPTLTDLRESGSIEQDADSVIGLYRPAYYIEKRKPALGSADPAYTAWRQEYDAEKNRLDLLVLKNRNGAEDSLSAFCDMRASAIRDERPRGAV